MTETQILVGLSDIQVATGPAAFECTSLGSCLAICLLDPQAKVSALAHVMLPHSFESSDPEKPGKFADTAIPTAISMMEGQGASRSRIRVGFVGGAQNLGSTEQGLGSRICAETMAQIENLGLDLVNSDSGGMSARSVVFTSENGEIKVTTLNGHEKVLCSLIN